jgi:hypothetical protein
MGWFGKTKKLSSNTAGTAEQKWADFLSDCEAVENTVNEYGGVLELTSKMSLGRPQSLLPRSKSELKQAIVKYLFCLHAKKLLDKKTFNILQIGYASLAFFLDEADAKIAISAQGAFNAAYAAIAHSAPNSDAQATFDAIDLERITSPNVEAAAIRSEKSNEEFKALSEEFDAVATKLGIKFQT